MNKADKLAHIINQIIKEYGSATQAYNEILHEKAPKPIKRGKKVILRCLRILMRKGY